MSIDETWGSAVVSQVQKFNQIVNLIKFGYNYHCHWGQEFGLTVSSLINVNVNLVLYYISTHVLGWQQERRIVVVGIFSIYGHFNTEYTFGVKTSPTK